MSAPTVREVEFGTPDHAQTLDLRRAVLLDPFGIELALAQADDEKAVHLAAFDEGRCIGCLLLVDRGAGSWQLRQMAVSPHMQRKGVGRQLVLAAVDWAREAGGRRMVAHAREPAVAFYLRVGFSLEGEPFVQVGLLHRLVVRELEPV